MPAMTATVVSPLTRLVAVVPVAAMAPAAVAVSRLQQTRGRLLNHVAGRGGRFPRNQDDRHSKTGVT